MAVGETIHGSSRSWGRRDARSLRESACGSASPNPSEPSPGTSLFRDIRSSQAAPGEFGNTWCPYAIGKSPVYAAAGTAHAQSSPPPHCTPHTPHSRRRGEALTWDAPMLRVREGLCTRVLRAPVWEMLGKSARSSPMRNVDGSS